MKNRSGFVSNSSSSSFIIPADGRFKCVADLAIYMISHRGWENDQADIDRIIKQVELGMSWDHPIAFQSCNYDTFIVRDGSKFYVATCNNHDWEFEEGGMAQEDPTEHYILYEMPYSRKYFNATFNLTGWKYAQVDREGWHCKEWCKECVVDLWVTDSGAPFCPKCGKKPGETDPFEMWWKNHSQAVPPKLMDAIKTVAKQAYEAGKKDGYENS